MHPPDIVSIPVFVVTFNRSQNPLRPLANPGHLEYFKTRINIAFRFATKNDTVIKSSRYLRYPPYGGCALLARILQTALNN